MKLLLGEYRHSLVEGKRISLPKKIRERISGGTVVLSKGFETYVTGFDTEQWEKTAEAPLAIPLYEERGRTLRRQVFASAVLAEVDEQGRVLLPENLLAAARIAGEEVIVVGVGDHFEIWDPVLWQRHLAKIEKEVGG